MQAFLYFCCMDFADKTIVFFDGECGFCNGTVRFLLNNDKNKTIHYSPLQSEFAQDFFKEKGVSIKELSTLFVYTDYRLFQKSAAFFSLLPHLKILWRFLYLGKLIPICWRDRIYDMIAKRRHNILTERCILPNAEERSRMLV